jgi:alkylation response protein AidB-like acyl-CoA dehydrogenase
MAQIQAPPGGAFLIEEAGPDGVLIPEELSAEARLMARTTEEFIRKEVLPVTDRLEAHEEGLNERLMRSAGELGLLAGGIPEAFGGLDLPKSTLTLQSEMIAPAASFAVTVGAHTQIGTLPILYFGTEEQKRKYLPGLASGEIIGAFALSEAESGSDALAAKTRATLTPDGRHYVLNGTKMWISNAAFADLFTVFGKVDGEQFTAFLVERNTHGLSIGREEHKLGIRGSSTCRIIMEDVKIPVDNVVGEVGKGYRVALYILNIGRFGLGAGALGASRELLRHSAKYANQRVQFGARISSYGLIQHKLAEMAVRMFALQSMLYRTAGYWDVLFAGVDAGAEGSADALRAATEEYAIECAILKFYGSEVLAYVADEGLQIHGGYGYTEEFPMARAYRDARINRIFEGTNEINRLTVLDQAMRRAQKGRLALPQAAARLKEAILSLAPSASGFSTDPLDEVGEWVRQIRNVTLYAAGQAWEALGVKMADLQEVAAAIADMSAALFALESGWLRARKLAASGSPRSGLALSAVQVYGADACAQVEQWARYVISAISDGDTRRTHAAVLKRLLKPPLVDTVTLRRQLAGAIIESEAYPW